MFDSEFFDIPEVFDYGSDNGARYAIHSGQSTLRKGEGIRGMLHMVSRPGMMPSYPNVNEDDNSDQGRWNNIARRHPCCYWRVKAVLPRRSGARCAVIYERFLTTYDQL